MHRFGKYAAAVCVSVSVIALLGYAVQAAVPQVPTGTWMAGGAFGEIPKDVASAVLADGRLVVTGGSAPDGQPMTQIAVYDPTSGTWTIAGNMSEARAGHTATALADGRVLIAGGRTSAGVTSSIEIYDSAAGASVPAGALSLPRVNHAATRLIDKRVLIVGGSDGSAALAIAEMFDPETGSIVPLSAFLSTPRVKLSATTLLDGHVLVAGGNDGTKDLASAEIFDADLGIFWETSSLSTPRSGHTAVLLPHNNSVLIAGGTSKGAAVASVERFVHWNEMVFAESTSMASPRSGAVAVPASRDGVILVGGGGSADAELYGFATLKTDKDDYAPGEIVTFTGSGWQPGETVNLTISEYADNHYDFEYTAVANELGNIINREFYPREDETYHHLGMRFYVMARGIASAAQMTFTDGLKVGSVTVGTQAGVLTSGTAGTASYEITVNRGSDNGSTGAFDATLTVTGGLPAGVTASFSPMTLSFTSKETSKTATLTLQTSTTTPAGAKSFTIRAAVSDSDFVQSIGTLTIGQPAQSRTTTTVTCPSSVAYSGAAQTPCTALATDAGGFKQELFVSYTANINVGTVTASASFPGDGTHDPSDGSATFTINKANAMCTISGYSGAFNGAEHGASGSCAGAAGDPIAAGSTLDIGAKFTNAPGGTAHWTFMGGTNYNDQNGDVAIDIAKANATVSVSGYSGNYDALAHGATGTATGVGGADLSAGLNLGETFTNVPGGTATWSFTSANYVAQTGTAAIVLTPATATINVEGYSGVYDAAAHGAHLVSAIGVGNADLSASVTLGGETFTNVPGGTATWSFTNANYVAQTGTAAIVLTPATATINVEGYSGVYDAAAHGAHLVSAIGVGNADLSASVTLGGETFTNVPGGTATWSFTNANYVAQTGTAAIVLTPATATINVEGYSGVYDAAAHGAHLVSATGVGNADLSASVTLGETFTNVPGGTAHWTFEDINYKPQSGDVEIVISKAPSTTTVTCPESVTYTGDAQTQCTVTIVGAGGLKSSATASYTNNVDAGTATASYKFAGDTNHTDSSDSETFVINKANAVVTVNGYTGVFDGQAHGATGIVVGVKGEPLAGLNLSGSFVNVPGGTAHWAFTDQTGNYNDNSGDAAIVITKAEPTVTVNGYDGVYNGEPHGAYGHMKGVLGESLAGLNLGASFTNVPGGTAHWTFTDPTGNYNDKSGDVQIVIYKADAKCTVTGYDVIFDNASHTSPGTCIGVDKSVLGGLDLSRTTHTLVGVYSDSWKFTDVTGNYNDREGTVPDRIGGWTTNGFYQPVDMSGAQIVWNTIKGGSTVPLKFNVYAGSVKKTNVSDVPRFAFAPAPCEASMIDATVEFTTTGGTQLRYDGTAGQFIQNWQTPKTAGKCYAVQLTALDGSTIAAYFKTK